jgi:hypothetical protein
MSFAQRAIARGVEAWCSTEEIVVARTETASFNHIVATPTAVVWLDLGDTLVGTEGLTRAALEKYARIAEDMITRNLDRTKIQAARLELIRKILEKMQ